MPKFLCSLFLVFAIHSASYADAWQSITGPTLLEGVVLMSGSPKVPDNEGKVEHFAVMVIKKVISGDAQVDYSLAFSYKGSTKDTLKSGDKIRVAFENNETLSSFSAITRLGSIYNASR